MPADRLLHPRIGDSEKVAACTDLEFRVWITYLLAADDFGVLPMTAAKIQGADRSLGGRPRRLIDRALEALVKIGLLLRFEHQGHPFIYSASWQSRQRVRYPRKTHYPPPPDDALARCDHETSELFREFHGVSTERTRPITETFQTPARAGGCEMANGRRLTANGSEGGAGETDPPMDVWARELVTRYPAQGRCSWNLVERPLFAALTADPSMTPTQAWGFLQGRLEQHAASHQWRVKGMIPRLDKWLREGMYLQELPETPTSTLVNEKTARSLTSAAAFVRSGHGQG